MIPLNDTSNLVFFLTPFGKEDGRDFTYARFPKRQMPEEATSQDRF